jgi:hypothetical protein
MDRAKAEHLPSPSLNPLNPNHTLPTHLHIFLEPNSYKRPSDEICASLRYEDLAGDHTEHDQVLAFHAKPAISANLLVSSACLERQTPPVRDPVQEFVSLFRAGKFSKINMAAGWTLGSEISLQL